MILFLDPSSSKTGFCRFDDSGNLVDAGLLLPRRTRDKAWERAHTMADEAADLASAVSVSSAVIEEPSPQATQGRPQRGQAAYGMAVGIVARAVVDVLGYENVYRVRADVWSRQRPKRDRAIELEATTPGYSREDDPGLDAADAIELGIFWFEKRAEEQHR